MQIIIGIYSALGVILLAFALQKRWAKMRHAASGLFISYLTLLLLFLGVEAYFRFFFIESSASPLAQKNWLARYWHTNEQGYRDRDWQSSDFEGKQVIAVVGDSFTAGFGINNPDDRYPDVLARLLGSDYALVNLGIYGSATPTQLEALENFDLATPDVVIWQYFINDIEYAALRVGELPPFVEIPEFAQQSYFLNYLAYLYIAPRVDYWAWEYRSYDNYVIWDLHKTEIEQMIDYVDSIGAELIVVIYPNMLDPVGSIPYVDRVAQAIEAKGQSKIIKLFNAVAAWPQDVPLTVSKFDPHASVEFNQYLAELIYNQYFKPES